MKRSEELEPLRTGWDRRVAWLPVCTENAGWQWLCLVDRKYTIVSADDDDFYYRYRLPEKA